MATDTIIRTKSGVPVEADFENIVTRDGGFTRIYLVIDTSTGRPYTRLADGTIQPLSIGGGSATGTNTGDVTLAGEGYLSLAGQVITAADINLTTNVTGVLPVANGGTNSSTALSGSSIMISNGTSVVQGAAGTSTTVLHGNAAGAPTYGAVSLTADVSGTLPVANGGTGLTGGTSGGILGYTAAGTLASSVALTANAIVLGGGAGATPTPLGSLGTSTTVLHGNATGAPTWGAISLTADVTGTLPVANGGTGVTSLGALTRVDDTNVTLTLGGSPSTALVNAASITVGWSGTLSVARGGTGLGSLGTANQLLGVNAAAGAQEYKTLSGTSNQISVTHGAGTITLATPQDIATGSSPTFAGLTLSGQFKAANGTVGAPSISFNSDQDNGLYYNTTNNWRLVAAGVTVGDVYSGGVVFAPAAYANGVAPSYTDANNAYMEYRTATGYAAFGAKASGANNRGVVIASLSAGTPVDAITVAPAGAVTFSAAPVLSALTASQAVFTDSSKNLVSNAITGSGNVVMSASPTLTGTVTAAAVSVTTLTSTQTTNLATSDANNVAIGSVTPTEKLHILDTVGGTAGTIKLGQATYYATIQHEAGVTGSLIFSVASASGGGWRFRDGATDRVLISQAGAVSGVTTLSASGLVTGNAGFVTNGYTVSPGGGIYQEMGVSAGEGNINVLNRTGAAFAPLNLNAALKITNASSIAGSVLMGTSANSYTGASRSSVTGFVRVHNIEGTDASLQLYQTTTGTSWEIGNDNTGLLRILNGGTDRFKITAAGVVNIPGLTASQAVFTDSSKNLVSNAVSGTGSVAMTTSPVFTTPTLGAASGTSLNLSGLTASEAVFTDSSKNLVSVGTTGSSSVVRATSPSITTPNISLPTIDVVILNEQGSNPSTPASGTEIKMYMKTDKIVFFYNNAGTTRYLYNDMTAGSATWTATTTPP